MSEPIVVPPGKGQRLGNVEFLARAARTGVAVSTAVLDAVAIAAATGGAVATA